MSTLWKITHKTILFLLMCTPYLLFYFIMTSEHLSKSDEFLFEDAMKNEKIAVILKINKANIEEKHGGYTALYAAVTLGKIEIVKSLIKDGANINTRRNADDTPVIVQAGAMVCFPYAGQTKEIATDIVRLLVVSGSDVNARNASGETAIMWAAKCGNIELANLLISNGANVNIITGDGDTPLTRAIHTSVRMQNYEIVKAFLAAGANANTRRNESGKSAVELANSYNDENLISMLKSSRSNAQLEPYLDERSNLPSKARYMESILNNHGIKISAKYLAPLANHLVFILFLPVFLTAIYGLARKDYIFLGASVAMSSAIIFTVGYLFISGLSGS